MNENDFQELLKLCKEVGGRYIFIEDGKPSFVLMNIEEYKKLFRKNLKKLSKEDLIEKINKEISAWREAQREKEIDENLEDEVKPKDEMSYYYNVNEKLDLDK